MKSHPLDPRGSKPRQIVISRSLPGTVSGSSAALALAAWFLFSAELIPFAVRMPRWIEIELVLPGWWLVWTCALTAILYRGSKVTDDLDAPSLKPSMEFPDTTSGCLDLSAIVPDEGCGVVLVILLLIPLVFLGIWIAVEILVPAVAFAAYFTIRGMLALAVNDRHECQGRWVRSLAWGTLSATLFTSPLALLIWAVQSVRG